MSIGQIWYRFMCPLLQSTFSARDSAKQTGHGMSLGVGLLPSLEKGNAAALAHEGDVVECDTRSHCSTLDLPPADTGSACSWSLIAHVRWWQPVPEQGQWDQELTEQIKACLQVLSCIGL